MRKKIIFIALTCFALVFSFVLLFDVITLASSPDEYEYTINTDNDFFIDSSLFTHMDDETIVDQGEVELTNFTKRLENSKIVLYSNSKNGAIRVLNKETNYYLQRTNPLNKPLPSHVLYYRAFNSHNA